MPEPLEGHLRTDGRRFAVVASRFNDLITDRLVDGAVRAFHRAGAADGDVTVVWVPGAFELPVTAKALAATGQYAAIVALGCVIRGATAHFDHVAGQAAAGIQRAALDTGVPVIFGVLTTDTLEQAFDRAGGKAGNKGAEAALTAVEMAGLMGHISGTRPGA